MQNKHVNPFHMTADAIQRVNAMGFARTAQLRAERDERVRREAAEHEAHQRAFEELLEDQKPFAIL